jgi:hypothetical protein
MLGVGGMGSRWQHHVWRPFRDRMGFEGLVDPDGRSLAIQLVPTGLGAVNCAVVRYASHYRSLLQSARASAWLARPWVGDRRLPWERRLDPGQLTPARVRRTLSALLPMVGTPASAPKPCGRSPGRPIGCRSGRATRYPALKKAA